MSAPKVGDRVRVTYEGTYDRTFPNGREMVHEIRAGDMFVLAPPDAKFEILRPPVKVGDVIEDQAQGESLPIRSVVRDGSANIAERFAEGWRWVGQRGSTFGVDLPATVLYLPDGAA